MAELIIYRLKNIWCGDSTLEAIMIHVILKYTEKAAHIEVMSQFVVSHVDSVFMLCLLLESTQLTILY